MAVAAGLKGHSVITPARLKRAILAQSAQDRAEPSDGITPASHEGMRQNHMHIDMGDGHVFRGSPLEILQQMQRMASGVEALDLDDYIDWVHERAATLEGVHIEMNHGGLWTRADSLLRGLVEAGLARDLEHWDDLEDDARPTLRFRAAAELAAFG